MRLDQVMREYINVKLLYKSESIQDAAEDRYYYFDQIHHLPMRKIDTNRVLLFFKKSIRNEVYYWKSYNPIHKELTFLEQVFDYYRNRYDQDFKVLVAGISRKISDYCTKKRYLARKHYMRSKSPEVIKKNEEKLAKKKENQRLKKATSRKLKNEIDKQTQAKLKRKEGRAKTLEYLGTTAKRKVEASKSGGKNEN